MLLLLVFHGLVVEFCPLHFCPLPAPIKRYEHHGAFESTIDVVGVGVDAGDANVEPFHDGIGVWWAGGGGVLDGVVALHFVLLLVLQRIVQWADGAAAVGGVLATPRRCVWGPSVGFFGLI